MISQADKVFSGITYSEFGIGYHKNGFGDDDYYVWYVYAANDDIYYSTKETTNEADLKPLSTCSWKAVVMNKVYLYKKNKISVPNNYTYVGEVHSASSENRENNYYAYVIDKVGNEILRVKNGSETIAGINLTNFNVKTAGNQWIVKSLGNNVYYSTKETANELDLKLLSTYKWNFGNMGRVYIYIKE